ncbi:MAG: hypothetical protein GTO40_23205, partial [Deltaproteobacteria bacterium]|nr:hypothetical protein [Deltaproteobacteria bacterium]
LKEVVNRTPQRGMYEGLGLKRGERVFMISDSTIDPILPEAFEQAIRDSGGHCDTVNLEGYPLLDDPLELVDGPNTTNWYPEWVWEGAKRSDIILCLAFFKFPHTPSLPFGREARKAGTAIKARAVQWELPPDMLLSPSLTYPLDVWDAIDDKTFDLMKGARRIEITEGNGTNLTFDLSKDDWAKLEMDDREKNSGRPYTPGHLFVPFPMGLKLDGQITLRSLTFGGPLPECRLTVEGRKVTKIEGGGKIGDTIRRSFEEFKDKTYPGLPGPGANWISTFAMCTNPKFRRSPSFEAARGSARVHSWCLGHRRSGFLHASIGAGQATATHKVIRHFDMMFPTVVADGIPVIEDGHLVALDDPRVRGIAERHGDPDEILSEDWIPDPNTAL